MASLLTTTVDNSNEWHTKAMAAKTLEEKVQAAVLAARNIKEKATLGYIYPRKMILEALDSPETTTKLTLQCLDEGDEDLLRAILPALTALEEICFYDCRMQELPVSALLLCKRLEAIKVVNFNHTGSYGLFVQHLHFELINMPSLKSIEMKTHVLEQPPANVFEEGCANVSDLRKGCTNILGLAKEWFNGIGGDRYRSLDIKKKVAWDASLFLSPSGRTPSIRREVRKLLMGQGDNRVCISSHDGARLAPWQLPMLDTVLCELVPSLKELILDALHEGTVRTAFPKILKSLLSALSLQLELLVFNNKEESETVELSSPEQISNFCNELRANGEKIV